MGTYLFSEISDQLYVSFRGDFINDVDPGDDLEEEEKKKKVFK